MDFNQKHYNMSKIYTLCRVYINKTRKFVKMFYGDLECPLESLHTITIFPVHPVFDFIYNLRPNVGGEVTLKDNELDEIPENLQAIRAKVYTVEIGMHIHRTKRLPNGRPVVTKSLKIFVPQIKDDEGEWDLFDPVNAALQQVSRDWIPVED